MQALLTAGTLIWRPGRPAASLVKHSALLRDVTGMNLRLADAARDRIREFLLVISHAKLRGATGAWVAPLAIV